MMRWTLNAALVIALAGCTGHPQSVAFVEDDGADTPVEQKLRVGLASIRATAVKQTQTPTEKVEKPAPKATPFQLPKDDAGKLLGKLLPPRVRKAPLNEPNGGTPATVPNPKPVELPGTTPLTTLPPVQLKTKGLKTSTGPDFVVEETLGDLFDPLNTPKQPSFTTIQRTRVVSEDPRISPALPNLAVPVPDRVSVDDVTTQVSTAAVLVAPIPVRTTTAPFVKITVPEPFENRKPLSVKVPPESSQVPESPTELP